MSVFDDQAAFMLACGQTIEKYNPDQAVMYSDLVDEEHQEWLDARTNAETADAVIDLIVVLIGYGLSKGWPMQKLWDEVHRSNMAKIDPATGKVLRRHDGKVMKPEGWSPPDLASILDEEG